MKLKNLLIFLIILTVLINVSCISAADNNTDILGEDNEIDIYVDVNTGDDSSTGDSWETPVKSIEKAIDLIDNNETANIYLGNGTYAGEKNVELNIENKNTINIIGSDNTIINGENLKSILTLSNINKITIKNVQFINATNKNLNYGVVLTIENNTNVFIENCQFIGNTKSSIYNRGNLTILNTYFSNNKDRVNDNWNSILGGAIYNTGNLNINNSTFKENYAGSGGAIYNTGNLAVANSTFRYNKATNHGGSMIVDSIKTRSDGGRGGDICNFGNATITNSAFRETQLVDLGSRGGSIYNNGTMLLKEVEISNIALISDDPIGRHSAGTAVANIGNLTLKDSLIANITTHITYQGRIQGAIQNEGFFTATRSIFANNNPDRVYEHQIYYDIGSGNIYNTGEGILNVTSCLFFNNNSNKLATVAQDVAIIAGTAISLENNSWSGEDPLTNYHIYGTLNVTKYWLLSLDPDYYMLEIGEKANITQTLKLMYEKHSVDYSQLPDLYVKFNVNGMNITKKIIDGKASVEFNQSDVKGSYVVTSTIYNIVNTADVDVGKEYSDMQVEAEEIYYGDDAKFYMTVTGNYTHQPTGNITVTIDGKKYTTGIKDTKASMTIPDLIPKTYDLIIRYEGDEDYFKSIFHHNYTVHKKQTYMNITIPEIYYGETGVITVSLSPKEVSSQAYMYITDENNKTTKKTVFVKNGTEIKLKNFAAGEYNITIATWDHKYYVPSNATALFKVKKFETNLTMKAGDIDVGEIQTLNITLSPKGEVAGEAILQINNHTEIIFLENGENNVTLENLTGGIYNVTVIFQGDKKYASSNATCTFTVRMFETNMTVKIEDNTLYINTTPNSTGKVLIYINDDIYEVNLTNSHATLPINFTKAENYIFIYYPGDGYYNYSTENLTYEYEDLLNLTGYDETFYNTQNQTYYLTLTDEEGYGIANRTIIFRLNNETFEGITGNDGSVTLKLDLNVGEYEITAQYRNKTAENKIIILEDAFITGNDTSSYTNVDFTYAVQLKDHNGKAIKNAKITFTINGKTYTNKTNKEGLAVLTLNLKEGNYNITAQYKTVNQTNKIYIGDILLKGSDLTIYNTQIGTYQLSLTDINGTGVANQTITITLNNKTYTNTTDEKGQTSLNFKLDSGIYTITAQLNDQTITNTITVLEDAFLSVNNTKAYENVDFTHLAKLTDHLGKAIENREITFIFENKTYTNKTNKEGLAVLTLNLKEGNYTITSIYKNITKTSKIIIIDDSHLVGYDVKAYSGTDFKYRVKLTDHNNEGIANEKITFEMNGKTCTNKTDANGQATLTFNLETGNYTITASYKNHTIENNFEIIEDYILTGNDVKAYSESDFTYNIKLTDHNEKTIKNAEITFEVNGKTYTNKTDVNGQAIITLNLKKGNYTITARYRNTTTKNNLTIIEDYILSGNNIKAYAEDDFTYKVNLTNQNGKSIKNAEITFKINGKTYTNTTNNKGQATITLNLKEGNYTITATYKNETTTNKLEIIEDYNLKGNDVKAYANDNFTYKVNLTNHNGKAVKNAKITFKINGKTYTNTTNNKGQATITLNLKEGNYTITATYKNTSAESTLTIIEDYNLIGNDIKAYANDNFIYKVNLTDHNGKAIKNAKITFTVNGQTYTNKTDANGQTTITLNLKEGNYTITATYKNIETTNKLEIIEDYNLKGNDVKANENNDFQYKVKLTDHNENPVESAEIIFTINNKTYKNTTDANGQATITLNLKEGNYTITATYKNIETTNKLEIIESYKLTGQNIKAYENTDFTYTITLTRTDGTPLSNKEITFIINNRRYTNMTNSEGKASKVLNLPEGNYTITAVYKDVKITNNLTIIEDYNLKGNNIKALSEKDFQYKVNLTDHNKNPIKNAEITFKVNGQTLKNKTDANGQATITLNLKEGNYTITTTYRNVETTNKLEIIETYQLNGINVRSYENFDFEYKVTLKNHNNKTIKDGEIIFEINGQTLKNKTDANGQATITLNLKKGNYTITATYKNETTTNKLEIIAYDLVKIISSDVVMYYHDGTRFKIQLLNKTEPLANKNVTIIINQVSYTRTTNENGTTSISLNLNSGKYNVTTKYNDLEQNNTVTIKSTITGNDLTKVFRNETQYYATFYNIKGELLKNTQITFNINGVFYERKTNENGTAKLNINLQQGTYIITATNPETQEQHTNNITVIPKIQENNDLTKYYRNDSQYTVKIIDSKGNPAKAGENVTFNINGIFYTRTVNETGYAKMNINLQPGKYTITAEYEGCKVSNQIMVLPVLKAKDITMKYRDGSQFKATLLNGQGKPYANQQVTFNINGIFYTRSTNESGTAKLNINLQRGEYIITTSYNGASISNKVQIE